VACDVTYEDVAEPRRKDMQKSSSMSTALKPHVSKLFMHKLHGYCQLVCDFNCKDLTYPKDVVDAFSGITTLLSDVFYGGFWLRVWVARKFLLTPLFSGSSLVREIGSAGEI
jgi:hypothetical protein